MFKSREEVLTYFCDVIQDKFPGADRELIMQLCCCNVINYNEVVDYLLVYEFHTLRASCFPMTARQLKEALSDRYGVSVSKVRNTVSLKQHYYDVAWSKFKLAI